MRLSDLPDVGGTAFNQKSAVTWLEQQPKDLQLSLAEHVFRELLSNAAKPKQSSGSSCSKLCGFVENCSKSVSHVLKSFAFAQDTVAKLFDFFIEWNEQDSHRSMRLVLDYIVSSINWNPDGEIGKSIKDNILNETISVITLQASRPSTKSSMIALDHLIQKRVVYLSEVLSVYQHLHKDAADREATWDSFVSRIFAWMELQNVWTIAGKLLVTIFTEPWYRNDQNSRHHPGAWHKFILNGLQVNPELLEPIKVYTFIPLFRADPTSSLIYLNELNSLQKLTTNDSRGWDINAMLWVAMLEAGKKTGVVGEPDYGSTQNMGVADRLPASILEVLLCHQSHEARTSGLSILLASPSTTKPYASETLDLLTKYLPLFYEDVDPKIRYNVLGHSRNMIRRLQNAVDYLRKELAHASKSAKKTMPVIEIDSTQRYRNIAQGNSQVVTERNSGGNSSKALCEHEQFINWYVAFLKGELVPTASYQRHITSLRAMSYFLKSSLVPGDESSITRWPANLVVDAMWFRSVLDLIMDPFDDVRETAASLIILLQSGHPTSKPPPQISGLTCQPFEELQKFCQKANELAQKTARADHCDGAARSQELLCRWSSNFEEAVKVPEAILWHLEQKLFVAEKDLAEAVVQAPVHGDFASLRYIWSSLTGVQHSKHTLTTLLEFQNRAIVCCQRIWRAVQHILCDDSPEGHLPEELQQVKGLDTKDLLSYSFRAIHESSNLMRIVANNARHGRENNFLVPSRQNFESIGRLTFDQLSNLRHRGAFSTVSQTFTACCQLVQFIPTQRDYEVTLLEEWYDGALNCIHTQASTTRRSAGIPAIIVGILASKINSPSFDDVITKLQAIAGRPAYVSETDGSNLSQVHALNCLKDIFKTSFLSHRAEPYLTDCLQLAAQSLQSEVWAIRNCGLLLLRSLIDNLFGTNENKLAMEAGWDGRAIRISYHKFEALPSLLLSLLELGKGSSSIGVGTQTAEAVFPALDIIRRAGPPEGYREKLYDIIAWYLGSHIWHVREIAARTLCSLLLTPNWLQGIKPLVTSSPESANKLHGALLTLRFLLERLLQVMPEQLSGENIDTLCVFLKSLSTSTNCLHTCTEAKAVFIDIFAFLGSLSSYQEPFIISNSPYAQSDWMLRDSTGLMAQHVSSQAPLALLETRIGEMAVQQNLIVSNEEESHLLDHGLKTALETDVNVACAMLEFISNSSLWQTEVTRFGLVNTYLQACFATDAPEPRKLALEGLASLIDKILSSACRAESLKTLPPEETLFALWSDLHQKPINPSLSDAIIRASGPLMAVSLLRTRGHVDDSLAQRLSSWGVMMSDAGMADRTFDTRIAAAETVKSFSNTLQLSNDGFESSVSQLHPAHIPWLLALYGALTDDDVEVREIAAMATTSILGLAFVPVEAGSRLLRWLAVRFEHVPDFPTHVAGRILGHKFSSTLFVTTNTTRRGGVIEECEIEWVPAEIQLETAMRFDDSLFVVEEQNQYIDEVREAMRWADVFFSIASFTAEDAAHNANKALVEWTLAGLRVLARIAQSKSEASGDGPLGWTSKPQVFAVCARILICASTLAKLNSAKEQEQREGEDGTKEEGESYADVASELRRFWELGRSDRVRIHGLLLGMCGIDG